MILRLCELAELLFPIGNRILAQCIALCCVEEVLCGCWCHCLCVVWWERATAGKKVLSFGLNDGGC